MRRATLVTATLMTAALVFSGCSGPPEKESDPVEATTQATTISQTVPAQEGTTANTGVKNWKLKYDKKKHAMTVNGVDSKGHTIATVGFALSKNSKTRTNTLKVTAKGFGESQSCTMRQVNGDGGESSNCNITQSGLLTEIVGGMVSDIQIFSNGGDGATIKSIFTCYAAMFTEVVACGGAAVELLLNPAADAACVISGLYVDSQCD